MDTVQWLTLLTVLVPFGVGCAGVSWQVARLSGRVESLEHKVVKLFSGYEARLPQCAVHAERLDEHQRQLERLGEKYNGLVDGG